MDTGTRTVLLDLGGVLTTDPWESLLLGEDGLADRLGLERGVLEGVGSRLWGLFSVSVRDAQEYWAALAEELGLAPAALDAHLVGLDERLLVHPDLERIAAALAPFRVGVMSDNTAFFHPLQEILTRRVVDILDPDLVFLSHRLGLSKSHRPGMLEHVAGILDPATVLFVDDRTKHTEHARSLGFTTHHLRDWSPTSTQHLLMDLVAFAA